MLGSVESPFEAQLHETVVIGLNTGVNAAGDVLDVIVNQIRFFCLVPPFPAF